MDVNSLYPSVMAGVEGEMLPFGDPKIYEGKYVPDRLYPLYIQHATVDFTLKEGRLPCIQLKNNLSFCPTEYVTDSKGVQELVLTSVDWQLLFDHYDVNYLDWHQGYAFKASKELFREYIDMCNEGKVQADLEGNSGMRYIWKLRMNSLYGKTATNPVKQSRKPVLDRESGIVKYVLLPPEHTDGEYLPAGAFITAWARNKTIRSAQKVIDRFIYADTDSLHLIGTEIPDCLDIDPRRLGAWKHESTFTRAKFIRPKTYVEMMGEEKVVHVAGMPEACHEHVTMENFEPGAEYPGKLYSKTVPGGIMLYEDSFRIKRQEEL